MRTGLVTLFVVSALTIGVDARQRCAMAQIVNPAPPYKSRLTLQKSGENAGLRVHRNPLGKPCLNIEAASKAHVINPTVYDNVVSVYNQCAKLIRLSICYYGTESCVDVEVPGYQRKDTVIGIRPNMQYFRYSYKEKF